MAVAESLHPGEATRAGERLGPVVTGRRAALPAVAVTGLVAVVRVALRTWGEPRRARSTPTNSVSPARAAPAQPGSHPSSTSYAEVRRASCSAIVTCPAKTPL